MHAGGTSQFMEHQRHLRGLVVDGRYRLTDFIGKGAYGFVYAANEETLGQVVSRVAVKIIPAAKAEQRAAVLNEIVGLACLTHDHIITYRASGEITEGPLAGSVFVATELGESTLADYLKEQGIPKDSRLIRIVLSIARALAHIHAHNCMHGDVKPANIFRVQRRWKLGDLGLLQSVEEVSARRKATPAYMAPEIFDHQYGPPGDIYSLGATVLFSLTGRYAHEGDSAVEFVQHLRTKPPIIPDDVPEPWHGLIEKCLQRDPKLRPTAKDIEQMMMAEAVGTDLLASMGPRTLVVSTEEGGDCATITEALKRAESGARIAVRPGHYRERLVITKPVEIIGDGPAAEIVVVTAGEHCLSIATTGPTIIRGVSFIGRPGADGRTSFVIDIVQGRVIMEDCDVRSAALACIAAHGAASEPTIRRCKLRGSRDAGVFVFDNARATFEECEIFDTVKSCVSVGDGGRALFRRCKVIDGQASGVYVFRLGHAIFEDSEIGNHARVGVAVATAGRVDLTRTKITGNKAEGVWLQTGAAAAITECDLTGNGRGPLQIPDGCDVTMRDNRA
jgi:hypothetical protein